MMTSTNVKFKHEEYKLLKVTDYYEIRNLLHEFDYIFNPILSKRISDLSIYAEKLCNHAIVYKAANINTLGFIVFYANNKEDNIAYLTQIAVYSDYVGKGVGRELLDKCVEISKYNGMKILKLEVFNNNDRAINFYKKNGFKFSGQASNNSMYMIKQL